MISGEFGTKLFLDDGFRFLLCGFQSFCLTFFFLKSMCLFHVCFLYGVFVNCFNKVQKRDRIRMWSRLLGLTKIIPRNTMNINMKLVIFCVIFGLEIPRLVFGFLYNMEDHCDAVEVLNVKDVMTSSWFLSALDEATEVDPWETSGTVWGDEVSPMF